MAVCGANCAANMKNVKTSEKKSELDSSYLVYECNFRIIE